MPIRVHSDQKLAVWGEVTAGTRPSPVTKAAEVPVISHELGRVQTRVDPEVLIGNRMPARPIRGLFEAKDRGLVVPFQKSSIGIWFYKFFEQYAVSGAADPYTHTFKAGGTWHAAGPYLGVELWDNGVSKGDVLDGMAIVGMSLEIGEADREARLALTLAGLGKGDFDNSARQDSTPTTFSTPFWNERDVEIKIDGLTSSYLISLSVEMRRRYSVRKAHDGTAYGTHCIVGGLEPIRIALRGLWDDTSALRALATGEAEHTISIKLKSPDSPTNHFCEFLFPEVQAFITNVPAVGGNANEREIELEGIAYFQDAAAGTCVQVTLQDPLATYVGYIQ